MCLECKNSKTWLHEEIVQEQLGKLVLLYQEDNKIGL
jgi:hypothetical protein